MTKGKKVLLVGPLSETGGVTKYVKDLMCSDLNYYKIIVFDTSHPIKNKVSGNGVGYKAFFNAGLVRSIKGGFISLINILKFPLALQQQKPSIVHICGVSFGPFWERALYIFFCKLFEKKIFLHYLGAFDQFYEPSTKIEKMLIKATLRQVDKIAFLSQRVKNIAMEFIPNEKLSVIPSSVKYGEFQKNVKMLFREQNEDINILFMGGADPLRKGILDVIKTIPIVTSENDNVRFLFTGGETVKIYLEKLLSTNMGKYVRFLGWIDERDKLALYKSADILVLPSYNEGLPYVIIEALAVGLPVIATNVGGIPEVIEEGVNGFLIQPGDFHALAKNIINLSNNEKLRKRISQENKEKAKSNYSLNTVLNQIKEIYDGISGMNSLE